MATAVRSYHFNAELLKGNQDLDGDTIKAILMGTGFVFDPETHVNLAAVSASELATGNGYTQQNKTLANPTPTEAATSKVVWDSFEWTASGGAIGPAAACILYNDTSADDTVVGCISFAADKTIPDGETLRITDPTVSETNA